MKTEIKVLIALLSVCCLFNGVIALDDTDGSEDLPDYPPKNISDVIHGDYMFYYKALIGYDGAKFFNAIIDLGGISDSTKEISLEIKDIDYISVAGETAINEQGERCTCKVLSVNPTDPGAPVVITLTGLQYNEKTHLLETNAKVTVAVNVEITDNGSSFVVYIPTIDLPVTIRIGTIITAGKLVYNGIEQSIVEMDSSGNRKYLHIDNDALEEVSKLPGFELVFYEKDSATNAGKYSLKWAIKLGENIEIPGTPIEWTITKKSLQDVLKEDRKISIEPIHYQQLVYTGKSHGPAIEYLSFIDGDNNRKDVEWAQIQDRVNISGDTEKTETNVDGAPYIMAIDLGEESEEKTYGEWGINFYDCFDLEWHIYKATISDNDVKPGPSYKYSFKSAPVDYKVASKITIKKNGEVLVENGITKNENATFTVELVNNTFVVYYEDENYVTGSYENFKIVVVKDNGRFKCVEYSGFKPVDIVRTFEVNIVTLDGMLLVNTIKLNGPITKETFDNKVFIYALGYVLEPEDYTLSVNDGWGRTILVDDEPGEINTTSSELNHIVLKGNENRGYTGTLEGWFRVTPDVGYEFSQGGLVYKVTSLSSKTLSVIGYEDGITDVKIPATVDNPIGDNGFKVTRIADKAFYTCTDLQSIDLGPVTNVGLKAFANCVSIESADLSSVKYIGAYSFFRCTGLTSVSFSDGLKSIGKSAFSGVSFDGKSAAVGDLAGKKFVGADGKLKLDNKGIVNGTEFSVDSLVYTVTDAKKKMAAVSGYEGEIIAVAVPATVEYDGATFAVKSIADNAFKGCKTLKSIDVSNVESIGFKAFANCDSLQYIDLVGEVKYIGAYAFFGCSALKMVDFGDGLKSIGTGAFGGITFVDASGKTISQSVSKLKGHIFAGSEKVLKLVA